MFTFERRSIVFAAHAAPMLPGTAKRRQHKGLAPFACPLDAVLSERHRLLTLKFAFRSYNATILARIVKGFALSWPYYYQFTTLCRALALNIRFAVYASVHAVIFDRTHCKMIVQNIDL